MRRRQWLGIGLVIAAAGGLWWLRRPAPVEPVREVALDLSKAISCKGCHAELYAEWESSYHAQAYLDPLVQAPDQANGFRKVQCLPCHSPAPVLEHGIGKGARVVERAAAQETGIECLSCHGVHGRIAGTRTLAAGAAPCEPVQVAELSSPALCAPCHNQHETVDEWEQSAFGRQGVDCLDCHMPEVTRTGPDGAPRKGRSHQFLGAHDTGYLQTAFEIRHAVETDPAEGSILVVELTNSGAGHNFPADARHRALDLVVTLVRPDGIELPAREARGPGQQAGTARRRFRNPYRTEQQRMVNRERYGRENTQIVSGETIRFEVPFTPADVAVARIDLIYKLTPYIADGEGALLHAETIEL